MNRFIRDYSLTIFLEDKKDGEALEILPPFRVSFTANKSIDRGLNKATIKIYNLSESTRNKLLKDETDKKYLKVILKCGYDELGVAFQGDIYSTIISRQGADIIASLNCIDAGYDLINSFTSKTVTSKKESINAILEDMPHTKKGIITELKPALRPYVLVGNSIKLIERALDKGESYFFENEKLYILKEDEVVSDNIPLIRSDTGMIGTPTEQDKKVKFETLMNTDLRLKGLCEIESLINERINGIYIIESITTNGDYDGNDWKQSVSCTRAKNYKVVKNGK